MRGPKKSTCPVAKTAGCFQSRLSSTVQWVTEWRNGHIFIFIFVAVTLWVRQWTHAPYKSYLLVSEEIELDSCVSFRCFSFHFKILKKLKRRKRRKNYRRDQWRRHCAQLLILSSILRKCPNSYPQCPKNNYTRKQIACPQSD